MKYLKELREHFSEKPVFTMADIKKYFSKKGLSNQYRQTLMHNLLEKNEINRITRGVYTFKTDPNAIAFAFSPCYFGLQDALSMKQLWEQETNPIIITTRKVRSGTRNIMGTRVIIRRIAKKMFFGTETIKEHGLWLPISDNEKTLIDFAYFHEPLDPQAAKELAKNIDQKKLENYLKKTPKKTAKKTRQLFQKNKNQPKRRVNSPRQGRGELRKH